MATLDSFDEKMAYIIGHTEGGMFLERTFSADVEIELARGGFFSLGFTPEEVQVFDDDHTDDLVLDTEQAKIAKLAEDSKNNILVSVFYIGHGVTQNGITSTEGESDTQHDVEEFLRKCSSIGPNVHAMGFMACCRRDRGSEGLFTKLE